MGWEQRSGLEDPCQYLPFQITRVNSTLVFTPPCLFRKERLFKLN